MVQRSKWQCWLKHELAGELERHIFLYQGKFACVCVCQTLFLRAFHIGFIFQAGACDTLILSHATKLWVRVGRETWPVSYATPPKPFFHRWCAAALIVLQSRINSLLNISSEPTSSPCRSLAFLLIVGIELSANQCQSVCQTLFLRAFHIGFIFQAGACDTLILSHATKLWVRVGRETWPVSYATPPKPFFHRWCAAALIVLQSRINSLLNISSEPTSSLCRSLAFLSLGNWITENQCQSVCVSMHWGWTAFLEVVRFKKHVHTQTDRVWATRFCCFFQPCWSHWGPENLRCHLCNIDAFGALCAVAPAAAEAAEAGCGRWVLWLKSWVLYISAVLNLNSLRSVGFNSCEV